MKKQFAILLTALVIISVTIRARNEAKESTRLPPESAPDYGIDFWGEAEGLRQSRIRSIVQTRDGYLWLGTDNGIVRFNGSSFTAFNVKTGSLKDNEVWAIQEDDEGGLWIGTYGGGLTLYKDGRFKTFTAADGVPEVVRKLDKDRDGNIWITTPNGATRYSHGVFRQFTASDGLNGNSVSAICANSSLGVLVATGSTLHQLVDGRFKRVGDHLVQDRDGPINHLLSSSDGGVWLGFHGQVKKWKGDTVTSYTWPNNFSPRINQLHEDRHGTLWVAMEEGVARLRDGNFESVSLGARGTGVVYSIYTDGEENIWIGFQSNGLGRLRTKQLLTISATNGLPNDSTRSVFQDSKGNVWIGTVDGFARYSDGKCINYQTAKGSRIGSVRSLAEDSHGNLWAGTEQGLLILKEGQLSKIRDWQWHSEIEVIYRDPRGHMWVGTDGDGLFEFDGNGIHRYRTEDGLASNQVRGLLCDRRGALWISTFGEGISRYADGKFLTYTEKEGLAGNRVTAIHEDEEGALWFATREGLSRFKDGTLLHLQRGIRPIGRLCLLHS